MLSPPLSPSPSRATPALEEAPLAPAPLPAAATMTSVIKRVERLAPAPQSRAAATEAPTIYDLDSFKKLTRDDKKEYCKYLTKLYNDKNILQLEKIVNETGFLSLDYSSLTDLSELNTLKKLTHLNLEGCSSLTDLSELRNLTNLTYLNLQGCSSLMSLSGLGDLKKLTHLTLQACSSLKDLSELRNLTNLTDLNLINFNHLTELTGLDELHNLSQLKHIKISNSPINQGVINKIIGCCQHLETFTFLKKADKLYEPTMIMKAIAKHKDEYKLPLPLIENLLKTMLDHIDCLSLYHIYLLTLLCDISDEIKLKLSNALNEKIALFSIDDFAILDLWSLYKINEKIGSITSITDSSFEETLRNMISNTINITSTMQLHEILEDPRLEEKLKTIPQESSELQNELRENGVYAALLNQITQHFSDATLKEEVLVKGHSLDIIIIANKEQLKINIELDGQHHQWAFQKSKDELRDKKLEDDGWIIVRIPNANLKRQSQENQIKILLDKIIPHIPSSSSGSTLGSAKKAKPKIRSKNTCRPQNPNKNRSGSNRKGDNKRGALKITEFFYCNKIRKK